jgi:hypothetical protein
MSTPYPVKVGTNYKDTFYLKNKATDAPITGKVQGDFTMQVSRGTTGNLATTGITITEVDASNNPGAYDVVASGSNSFTSTTAGKAHLTIRLTSDNYYTFEQTILVTADGTFEGSSGAARFTATASDGRITDGSSPLTGVTVRLLNSANTIVAQTTSDASGLWGPVFLDATVTVSAQKSGYAVNTSSTVTVAGTTATGPAADIALTAVSSSSSILCSDLTAYARVQARNVQGSQSDTVLLQAVNNAIAWVATSKFWERYKTHGEISLQAPYETGTVVTADADTTVVLTGGTWPTWAASGKVLMEGKLYRAQTRTSGSDLELTTAWKGTALAAATFKIIRDEYALPTDCLKFGRFYPGQAWGWGGDASSMEDVLIAQHSFTYGESYPAKWCIHATGNTDKLMLYPYPTTSQQLPFWYYRKPALMTSGGDTADVDALQLELLQRSIDYQVAIRYETCVAGDPEKCLKRLLEAFNRFSSNDKAPINPSGPLGALRLRGPSDPKLTQ